MTRMQRTLAGILLAGGTVVALAGCAAGSVDGSAASADDDSGLATVRVGIFPSSMNAVFAYGEEHDIFEERGISRDGAIVIVRPDHYVAHVLPLGARIPPLP